MIEITNPYVGLRPFDTDESILFFGRNEQTLELLQRLHIHHFVAVVGSSGCGKSSLLRAGLIPALKAGYLVDDSDEWYISIMKPGQNPIYNLAESILLQTNPESDAVSIGNLSKQIEDGGADVIIDLMYPYYKNKQINFFLLVDQFEELFRFIMDKGNQTKIDEAIDFVNILLELTTSKKIPFYAVMTMRSDFIGDCTKFYGLPEAMNQSLYLVPRLNRVQLKLVIEGPAKLFGGKLDPLLTSRLLGDLEKVKDELPLLEHELMRMWEYEFETDKSGLIDLEDYEKVGGIEWALNNQADETLVGMSEEDLRLTKSIFQALTAIDENGRKIRRPVLLSQLKELTGASETRILHIIQLFIRDNRSFLIISNAGDTGDKVIDISHESLIRQWVTLCKWVDEEGESSAVYYQLAEASQLFHQNKKDLLTGSELQLALAWRKKFNPSPVWANRYKEGFDTCMAYLSASEKQEQSAKKKKFALFGLGVLLLIFAIGALINAINTSNTNKKQKVFLLKTYDVKSKALSVRNLADSLRFSSENKLSDLNMYIPFSLAKLPPKYDHIKAEITTLLRNAQPKGQRLISSNLPIDLSYASDEFSNEIILRDQTFSSSLLHEMMPKASKENIKLFIAAFNNSLDAVEIYNKERFVAFIAVIAYTSKDLTSLDKSYSYSAEKLMKEYSNFFNSMDSAKLYEFQEEKIANRIGANQGDNRDEASGDGWRYRGRGIVMIETKTRYQYWSDVSGYPLVERPELLNRVDIATSLACLFWSKTYSNDGMGLNKLADEKKFSEIADYFKTDIQETSEEVNMQTMMNNYKRACRVFGVK